MTLKKLQKELEERSSNELEEWSTFLLELTYDAIEQNVGGEEFLSYLIGNLVTLEKSKLIGDGLYVGLILSTIKLNFLFGYPELSFDRNYTLEMREVKVYED